MALPAQPKTKGELGRETHDLTDHGIEVKSGVFGVGIVATRNFDEGELIFETQLPLLPVDQLDQYQTGCDSVLAV